MNKRTILWVTAGVILLGAAAWGPIVSNVEQPKYAVVQRVNNIEIRDYAPMIVAETHVSGQQKEAIGRGFRIIATYIFGENLSAQKIDMTAPVSQQVGEKIAMTAPVTQQSGGETWQVRFVMPSSNTMATLPKPKNPAVTLREIPAKRLAVIRFAGLAGQESLKRHTDELEDFIRTAKLTPTSPPIYAFYNPPWTLPFFRRNEVMIEFATASVP
jgi:DNA gyrase inhibitor GyrI